MIDIHTHLLPGVDDGSPSFDVSVPVLERFAEEGVTTLVCTPHLNASQVTAAPVAHHHALLEELQRRGPAALALKLGWEIMLDAPNVDLSAPELTLGGSRALLVEFTRGGLPRGATAELRRIARSGRTPILAHPERYFGCTLEAIREWRAIGVVIQTDASVLMGRGVPAELARAMLAEGLIDILASDNHGDSRSLAAVHEWLLERGGDEQLTLLTHTNAECVLNDEDPLPVPPLRPGLLARVKRLFGR
ncbi:tyrosine-protein phosphatase [Gemmatimonas sp.]|uniref:tyrosine-protein phosphatase n=1 Tax=Gemmatimonas sp. TaxID=1962908 RepID=UPI0037C08815